MLISAYINGLLRLIISAHSKSATYVIIYYYYCITLGCNIPSITKQQNQKPWLRLIRRFKFLFLS